MQQKFTTAEGYIDRSSVDRRSGQDRRGKDAGPPGPIERRNIQRRKENRGGPTELFKFREITTATDLFWAFRTRYEVYRDVGFIPPNDDGLDIDGYDLRSVHLGAFVVDQQEERMVGTIRHVTWQPSPVKGLVRELAGRCEEPSIRQLTDPQRVLPLLESFDLPRHEQAIEQARAGDGGADPRPFEVSRLTVLPRHWHKGLTRGIHELVTLWCHCNDYRIKDAVIATNPNNARKYKTMGFAQVPGTGEITYKGLNQPAVALEYDLQQAFAEHPYYQPCATVESFFAERGFFMARY